MKVLSIQMGHNATVALANKGEIVGVLGQEKCDNIKNSSAFPKDAIKQLLNEVNWNFTEVEKILISVAEYLKLMKKELKKTLPKY